MYLPILYIGLVHAEFCSQKMLSWDTMQGCTDCTYWRADCRQSSETQLQTQEIVPNIQPDIPPPPPAQPEATTSHPKRGWECIAFVSPPLFVLPQELNTAQTHDGSDRIQPQSPMAGKASDKEGILPEHQLLARGKVQCEQRVARAIALQFCVVSMSIQFTFCSPAAEQGMRAVLVFLLWKALINIQGGPCCRINQIVHRWDICQQLIEIVPKEIATSDQGKYSLHVCM